VSCQAELSVQRWPGDVWHVFAGWFLAGAIILDEGVYKVRGGVPLPHQLGETDSLEAAVELLRAACEERGLGSFSTAPV
jgi:hypothetical protein